MAVLTAQDFAQQMVAQARILDPNFSGEVGTPERKIIDTLAESLAENQVDLTGLQSALDIDSKYGSSLDRFTALFGFQRQQAIAATGFVVFSRPDAAPANIIIPVNTQIQSSQVGTSGQALQYVTTTGGTIAMGQTTSAPVPIQCITPGTQGNVLADTITIIIGNPVNGVTAVTNPNPLTNGIDGEDDNSYKVRFKNTWARNLAGTESQYLALAISGTFTTKANVIGVQSRYQEYTQVPDYDDAGYLNGTLVPNQNTTNSLTIGQGIWTTALSSIPYAKQLYTNTQVFVSNGQQGAAQFYYRPGVDFQFNPVPVVEGDTIRTFRTQTIGSDQIYPGAGTTLQVQTVLGVPTSGTFIVANAAGTIQQITYTGITSTGTTGSLTGCSTITGTIAASTPVYIIPTITGVQPNFTLLNVFNPSDGSLIPGVQAMAPQDIILTEFSYISSASRNDINHNVVNAVDVYVNGSNDVDTSTIFLANAGNQTFNINSNSPWYYENFRRDGNAVKRPQIGNYFTSLFQSPVSALPDTIVINGQNYYLGFHYWLVHEISNIGGSIRSRDGIEWNKNLLGDLGTFPPPANPIDAPNYLLPYFPTGGLNIVSAPGQGVEVNDYTFDSNVITLQAAMENARQITTDVLVHRANTRYFKLDITVMYSPNSNFAVVNSAIGTAVQAYLDRQFFGTVIQLSDLLEIIHEVPGVDNVRWSNDLNLVPDLIRLWETDNQGHPLHGASVDRFLTAPAGTEQQTLYIVGKPVGTLVLSWADAALPVPHVMTTTAMNLTNSDGTLITATTIQNAIRAAEPGSTVGMYHNITVTADVRPITSVSAPIRSFTITYSAAGQPMLPSITQNITSSDYTFDNDFFLFDSELPSLPAAASTGDTVPGLIIRPRAQPTFFRPGLG